MKVYLAAQVFSNRVAFALQVQGKPGTAERTKFVKNMTDFFFLIVLMQIKSAQNLNLRVCTAHLRTEGSTGCKMISQIIFRTGETGLCIKKMFHLQNVNSIL